MHSFIVILFFYLIFLFDNVSSFQNLVPKLQHRLLFKFISIKRRATNELLSEDFFDKEDNRNNSKSSKENSQLQSYFNPLIFKLGKVPKSHLRQVISRHNQLLLPDIEDDMETHIYRALDVLWTAKNGDWAGLLQLAEEELDEVVNISDLAIKKSVEFGGKISESKIKELLRVHSESGNIPKFDKRKYTGKLLKTDYLAALIDQLRENFHGDYQKVAQLLENESKLFNKRGFGE